MVFVRKSSGTRNGAFGYPNVSSNHIRKNVVIALTKAKQKTLQLAQPTTTLCNVDRLRRSVAHAMCLDIVFAPRFIMEYKSNRFAHSRLPTRRSYEISPVWRTAPGGALYKAGRLCSLLHEVAVDGWKANVSRLLTRLSIYIWRMSRRDFDGVCRAIRAKIALASKADFGSSPDPLLRFGALSNNPISNPNCVFRNPIRHKCVRKGHKLCTSRAPKKLGVQQELLNTAAYRRDIKSVRKRLLQWFTPHGLESVRELLPRLTMR